MKTHQKVLIIALFIALIQVVILAHIYVYKYRLSPSEIEWTSCYNVNDTLIFKNNYLLQYDTIFIDNIRIYNPNSCPYDYEGQNLTALYFGLGMSISGSESITLKKNKNNSHITGLFMISSGENTSLGISMGDLSWWGQLSEILDNKSNTFVDKHNNDTIITITRSTDRIEIVPDELNLSQFRWSKKYGLISYTTADSVFTYTLYQHKTSNGLKPLNL